MQYLTQNMTNSLTFYASQTLQQASSFVLRFLYCGSIVKEIDPVEPTVCNCKATVSFWHPCNQITTADTAQLIADDEVVQEIKITVNPA